MASSDKTSVRHCLGTTTQSLQLLSLCAPSISHVTDFPHFSGQRTTSDPRSFSTRAGAPGLPWRPKNVARYHSRGTHLSQLNEYVTRRSLSIQDSHMKVRRAERQCRGRLGTPGANDRTQMRTGHSPKPCRHSKNLKE